MISFLKTGIQFLFYFFYAQDLPWLFVKAAQPHDSRIGYEVKFGFHVQQVLCLSKFSKELQLNSIIFYFTSNAWFIPDMEAV